MWALKPSKRDLYSVYFVLSVASFITLIMSKKRTNYPANIVQYYGLYGKWLRYFPNNDITRMILFFIILAVFLHIWAVLQTAPTIFPYI